ncbi:citrate/2-methylcitrate synthase [Rhizomonospora bruguierae]|uniref:citrate/2-methylcitrate synthase n=1 Tax=Rhizomonospora bruguierae TaxID=1581705 RepID=UPI001BCFF8FF|nr:citrate/2-methylcitrate synthase [Micromonospora sp. NBRC 107566]
MSIPQPPWHTALTSTGPGGVFVRGRPVADLMRAGSFVATLLLLWTGRRPPAADVELVETCLIACVDHGAVTPSALATRTAASTGNRPLPSAATGLLATGPLHGAAVTACAELLAAAPPTDLDRWAEETVDRVRRRGGRVPGLGHRWHREDPRTAVIVDLLAAQNRGHAPVAAAQALARALSRRTGKHQCVNVDGGLALAVVTIGLPAPFGDCLFGLARLGGLSAHAVEESTRQRPMRVIEPELVRYDGPAVQSATPEKVC